MIYDPDSAKRDHALAVVRDPASSPEDKKAAREHLTDDPKARVARMTNGDLAAIREIYARLERLASGEPETEESSTRLVDAAALLLHEAELRYRQVTGSSNAPDCPTCHSTWPELLDEQPAGT